MERLSGLDASFLYLETPTLHMHVALTLVFDPSTVPGGYSFARMKASIASRIPLAPVFRRRLVEVPFRLGHPVWVDDPDFDIDYHVRLTAVPRPGGLPSWPIWPGTSPAASSTGPSRCGRCGSSRAWPGGRIGLIAKMHHSTVDGVSGAALLSVLFDLEPNPAPRRLHPPERPSTPASPRASS